MAKNTGATDRNSQNESLPFWGGVSVTTNGIERDFREKVCAEIRLLDEGMDRYRVFTPFQLNNDIKYRLGRTTEGQED